jgi:hypothetical protein
MTKTSIFQDAWTKIGNNVSSITFQNQSATPFMIIITAADTAPNLTDVGMVYSRYEGELKKLLSDLTYTSSPAYVWVRSITKNSSVVHESA